MVTNTTKSNTPYWLSLLLSILVGILFFITSTIFLITLSSQYIEKIGANFPYPLLDFSIYLISFILSTFLSYFLTKIAGKLNKIVIFILTAPLLLLSFLGIILFFMFDSGLDKPSIDDLCHDKTIEEFPSPDNKMKAVLFSKNCGATTNFTTHVVIIPKTSELSQLPLRYRPSFFSADCNHGTAPIGKEGGPEVKLTWTSSNKMTISHHKFARVYLNKPMAKGISIEYRNFE